MGFICPFVEYKGDKIVTYDDRNIPIVIEMLELRIKHLEHELTKFWFPDDKQELRDELQRCQAMLEELNSYDEQ
jgi:hypothetical protein